MKIIKKQMEQRNNEQNKEYYRNIFYQKWGNYENYLKECGENNNRKRKEKRIETNKERRKKKKDLYLKVKGENNDELWISPEGTKREFFFTCGKITMEEIKNFKWENNEKQSFEKQNFKKQSALF